MDTHNQNGIYFQIDESPTWRVTVFDFPKAIELSKAEFPTPEAVVIEICRTIDYTARLSGIGKTEAKGLKWR